MEEGSVIELACEECGMLYGCTCDYEDLSEVDESESEEEKEEEEYHHVDEDTRVIMFCGIDGDPVPKYVRRHTIFIRGVPASRANMVDVTELDDELEVNFLQGLVGQGEGDELYVTQCGKVPYDPSRDWVFVSSKKAKDQGKHWNSAAMKEHPDPAEEIYGPAILVQYTGLGFYSFPPIRDLAGYRKELTYYK